MDLDVLIVGAGPTGLMLANQLIRRGVRILLINCHPGLAQQTRALGVQARTLEIYAKLGIVNRALELGKRGSGAMVYLDPDAPRRLIAVMTRMMRRKRRRITPMIAIQRMEPLP